MSGATEASGTLLMDAEELARELGVGVTFIYESVNAGRIPQGVKIGRCRRWRRAEIVNWLEAGCPAGEKWVRIKGDK